MLLASCASLDVDIAVSSDGSIEVSGSAGNGNSAPPSGNQTPSSSPSTPAGSAGNTRKGPSQYEVFGKTYTVMESSLGYLEIGIASWYGKKFHGRLTANGEVYDMYGMTAAHKALPLPTAVKVTNLDNARSVVLRVNDRGPFHDDRVIDLSYAAARALGFDNKGTAPVVVEALDEINYPELAAKPQGETYYLQAGAFSREKGAESRLADVRLALPEEVPARILESEQEDGRLIYKVWIGPLDDLEEELTIERRIIDRNLGRPIRVTVE